MDTIVFSRKSAYLLPLMFLLECATAAPLNDTGITQFADDTSNDLSTEPATHPGQDASHGRDVIHNDASDGHAGFSFTKLDANGNPLPASATSWSCVKDNVTGLIWEVKTDDGGLHDKDDTYNWYNTDNSTNGGHPGYADDDGNICYGYDVNDSSTYCNTKAYVSRVNAPGAGLCGYHDWRLPGREELRSIVHHGRNSLLIDMAFFPNTVANFYWSSSAAASNSDFVWHINFYNGGYGYTHKGLNEYVRLVRSGQALPSPVITATPIFVRVRETSTISWDPKGNTGCTLSGPGLTATIAPTSGSEIVTIYGGQNTYIIDCGEGLIDSVLVRAVPTFSGS